jgi:DNA-directed RNA polymerase specialized sigma24 family protein
MRKIEIDEVLLRKMVEVDKLQQGRAAKLLGVSDGTLRSACRQYDIATQRSGPRAGALHPKWNGGRRLIAGYWYIYCPDHPFCTLQKAVAEHRLVMEKHLGRYLQRNEVVHHRDGNAQNNLIDNLELFQANKDHLASELKGRRPNWTASGVARILQGTKNRDNSYLQLRRIPVDHEQLVLLFEEGTLTKKQIAEKLGVSINTINRHCQNVGFLPNWKSRRPDLRTANQWRSERDG